MDGKSVVLRGKRHCGIIKASVSQEVFVFYRYDVESFSKRIISATIPLGLLYRRFRSSLVQPGKN